MAEAQATGGQAVVRNISDTARWAAVFRARETERADALFRDPYAERLAGKMGVDIANTLPEGNSHAWAWVARTYLFDRFIAQEIEKISPGHPRPRVTVSLRQRVGDRKSTRLN